MLSDEPLQVAVNLPAVPVTPSPDQVGSISSKSPDVKAKRDAERAPWPTTMFSSDSLALCPQVPFESVAPTFVTAPKCPAGTEFPLGGLTKMNSMGNPLKALSFREDMDLNFGVMRIIVLSSPWPKNLQTWPPFWDQVWTRRRRRGSTRTWRPFANLLAFHCWSRVHSGL